jgi:hypothetical protein
MFSSKTSRSHSVSSLLSLGEGNMPPVENVEHEEQGVDVPNTQRWTDDLDYRFTSNHPLGSILLKLVQDTTNLARKNNTKSMVTNVEELCSAFHNGIRLERAKLNNKFENTMADVEKSLMDKELNHHAINASVMPPTVFSNVPTLDKIHKLTEVMKIFPKASRFSGNTNKDGHMSVVEFLNALTAAQKQCTLSEEEFIDRILYSSTGLAHDLILEWKTNGDDASTIYHSLLTNFDTRMSPEEAKNKLINFTIGKNSNLAKAESSIQLLVGRAAAAYPPGESRNAFRNMEGCTTLIRALPPYSSLTANNLYQSYTTRLGRACTMHELFRGLDQYRGMIDRDIKANGASMVPRYNNNVRLASRNNNNITRYSSFNNTIEATKRMERNDRPMRALPPPPMANKRNDLSYTPRPLNRKFNNNRLKNKYSNNNNPRHSRPFNRYPPNTKPVKDYCPLCGQGHKTADCKNIRDDSGNVLEMHPTYQTCSKCPPFVKPRLRHPEFVCPYRVGGPLHRNIKN